MDLRKVLEQKRVIVSGHRGDMTGKDENTMAAFRRALSCGCEMVETDVRMTKDGQIVLRHDSRIEGIGEIRDHTCEELRNVRPDLALLSELAELAAAHPDLGLLIELKDVPSAAPGNGLSPVTGPAPYSGKVPACSGRIYGPEPGRQPLQADLVPGTGHGDNGAVEESRALACADKACRILLEHGLQDRVWILSFSGRLLEYVYRKYGNTFHYHAFYPWFIQGDMDTDPASFCELVCMQHRYLTEDGRVIRYEDPVCPESWWQDVLDMGMVPIGAPSLKTVENFREAVRRGCRVINANDPPAIRKEFCKGEENDIQRTCPETDP